MVSLIFATRCYTLALIFSNRTEAFVRILKQTTTLCSGSKQGDQLDSQSRGRREGLPFLQKSENDLTGWQRCLNVSTCSLFKILGQPKATNQQNKSENNLVTPGRVTPLTISTIFSIVFNVWPY